MTESADTGEEESPDQPTALDAVIDQLDADVLLFSGGIDRAAVAHVLDVVEEARRRPNVALILCTEGGDADAAFILTRCLKAWYTHFTLYVFGLCKSAGTIIALGADDIVMAPRGEFGPLDVQIAKEDEVISQSSGLDIPSALTRLGRLAFDFFERDFLTLKGRSGGNITTKTAADIAATLAVGLLSPITAQVDPLKLGQFYRATDIASKYGGLLRPNSDATQRLIMEYPSHGFVIDFEQAKDLFTSVRPPTELECQLERELRDTLRESTGYECVREPHPTGIHGQLTSTYEGAPDAKEHACAVEDDGEPTHPRQPAQVSEGQRRQDPHSDEQVAPDHPKPTTPRRRRTNDHPAQAGR